MRSLRTPHALVGDCHRGLFRHRSGNTSPEVTGTAIAHKPCESEDGASVGNLKYQKEAANQKGRNPSDLLVKTRCADLRQFKCAMNEVAQLVRSEALN